MELVVSLNQDLIQGGAHDDDRHAHSDNGATQLSVPSSSNLVRGQASMKAHIGGSFQPAVVDTNRYQTGDLISLWRKSAKIQTTGRYTIRHVTCSPA